MGISIGGTVPMGTRDNSGIFASIVPLEDGNQGISALVVVP